jgi:beta-phosphoglucomutase-like phosphatase (HAD superfamily)
VGFEDSVNGLKAVRAAGLLTVGLATTNSRETVATLADIVVDDFTQLDLSTLSIR